MDTTFQGKLSTQPIAMYHVMSRTFWTVSRILMLVHRAQKSMQGKSGAGASRTGSTFGSTHGGISSGGVASDDVKSSRERHEALEFPRLTADQTESTTAEQMIRIWCGHKNGMNPCARGGCFCCACVDFAEDVRQRELDLAQFDLEDKAGKPPGFEAMMRSWWDTRANVNSLRFHARCTPDEPNPLWKTSCA